MNTGWPAFRRFIGRSCARSHAGRSPTASEEHRMNTIRSITASRVLLTGVIAIMASAAWAQDTPTPPTSDQAKKEMQSNKKDPLAIQSSGPEDWSMLKGHEKGYVSKSDALPNSWLEHNFQKCDADQDGKVTEAEYTKCQKAM
jgi:hypothetical protein